MLEKDTAIRGEIKQRGGVSFVESTTESREFYFHNLQILIEKVRDLANGNEGWWVVGGIARDAWIGKKKPVVASPEGTLRDVDFVFSSRKRLIGSKIRRSNPTPIPVGMPFQWCLKVEDDKAEIRLGKINLEVPKKTFETHTLSLEGVGFPSLPIETLFHLYCLGERPGGKMREKDFLGALDLARQMKDNSNPRYPKSLYKNFHQFAKRKNGTEIGFCQGLMSLAGAYRNSSLNNFFPIGKVASFLRPIWETSNLIESGFSYFNQSKTTGETGVSAKLSDVLG